MKTGTQFRLCDDGESFYAVMIIDRAEAELTLGEMLRPNARRRVDDEEEVAAALTGWTAYENGVGRWFGTTPVVKVYAHAVLIRQLRALDI